MEPMMNVKLYKAIMRLIIKPSDHNVLVIF